MAVQIPRYRFTVGEYYRMGEAGIFTKEDRVELLDGEIVQMSPIGVWHAYVVQRANVIFVTGCGALAVVRIQSPVHLDDHNEPQPDLVLARPRPDGYSRSHPGREDVLLVVEVADSSAPLDRQVKLPLYARAQIPEVWLLVDRQQRASGRRARRGEPALEAHREPTPAGYAETRIYGRGERISPVALPGVEFAVDDLLGA